MPEGEISPALLSMLEIRVMGWSTTTDILDFLADELSPSSPSLALTLVLDPSPTVFVSPGKYSFLVAWGGAVVRGEICSDLGETGLAVFNVGEDAIE
jgi:hypothetical protein